MEFISYAANIKIAPLAVYDNRGSKMSPPFNPEKAIHAELEKHWFEGLLHFASIAKDKYGIPVTIIDAHKICESESIDYLLYGYIKKNEANWFSEIKFYDASKKKVIKEFFASDDTEHYERMIDNLKKNILYGIEEITGLNQNELREEKTRAIELNIPASIFYWSPIDVNWGDKVLGIAGINIGLEFYPPQPVLVFNGKLIDLSARFNLLWNIGINKENTFPLIFNTIAISFPIIWHVHFNTMHSVYAGIGLAYEIEFMKIQPKYEDKQFFYQNIFSLKTPVGYELTLNEIIKFFVEITFDYHLTGDGFISIEPGLGVSFNVFKERK